MTVGTLSPAVFSEPKETPNPIMYRFAVIAKTTALLCLIAGCALAPLSRVTPAARADNPGVVTADPAAFTQIVAISDVHGEYENARRLLQNAHVIDAANQWTGGKTLLVVTGDSIDKGPQSVEVLRLWMALQTDAPKSGGLVLVLLGNHEAEFLTDPTAKKSALFVGEAAQEHLALADLTGNNAPIGHFLRTLPLAARVGKWAFCHAGWIPDMPVAEFTQKAHAVLSAGDYKNDLVLADDGILEKKDAATGGKWYESPAEIHALEARLTKDGFYGVVFGHQPDAFAMPDAVGFAANGRFVKIDSGMAPAKAGKGGNAGHLLVFAHPSELAKLGRPVEAYSVAADGTRVKL